MPGFLKRLPPGLACPIILVASALALCLPIAVRAAQSLDAEIVETNGSYAKLNVGAPSGLRVGERGAMLAVAGLGDPTPAIVTSVKPDYVVVKLTEGEPLIGQIVRFDGRPENAPPVVGDPGPVAGSPFWKPEEIASANVAPANADGNASDGPTSGSPFWKPGENPSAGLDAPEATFEALRDKDLEFEWSNGQKREDLTISGLEVENGHVLRLRAYDRKGSRHVDVDLAEIACIRHQYQIVWTNPSPQEMKTLAERRREINRNQMEERAARRNRAIAAIVAETGQTYWPELTPEQRIEFIEEEKRFADEEVSKRFTDLRLYETEHFLFYSTIPPKDVGRYILQLDRMYDLLVKLFQLSPTDEVFRGKGVVYAFRTQKEFMIFETEFMHDVPDVNVLGICHNFVNGRALLACFMGDDPLLFEKVLVHEMSHGFVHRYKTPVNVPSWLDEGIAEYVAKTLVPKDRTILESMALGVQLARTSGRLGDDLFNPETAIDAEEYGPSAALVIFLLKDSERFVQLFEGVKGGLPPEQALSRAYGIDYAELTQAYGRTIGMPALSP